MNKIHFTTSINCGNCVRAITPILNAVEGIHSWSVDTDDPKKVLTVETNTVAASEIITVVYDAGFDIAVL